MTQLTQESVRVLIVDDYSDTAESMALLLRLAFGCDARGCCDGAACVEAALAFQPHLLLLDLKMPGMNGFEVVEALQRTGRMPPFVVAVSGYGDQQTKSRCAEEGFHSHEVKPITLERAGELIEYVAKLTAHSP